MSETESWVTDETIPRRVRVLALVGLLVLVLAWAVLVLRPSRPQLVYVGVPIPEPETRPAPARKPCAPCLAAQQARAAARQRAMDTVPETVVPPASPVDPEQLEHGL